MCRFFDAACDAYPRTPYLVTRDAKIAAFMHWLLPDRAFDAVSARLMKSSSA